MANGCAACCSGFALVAAALLFVFAGVVRNSMTWNVIGVSHGWDMAEKSHACVVAAIIYLVLSALCAAGAFLPDWLRKKRILRGSGYGSSPVPGGSEPWSPTRVARQSLHDSEAFHTGRGAMAPTPTAATSLLGDGPASPVARYTHM